MKSIFSKNTIRNSIDAHTILGLTIGYFMYLLCLTGTLLVAAEYWERWEQPHIPEFSEFDPTALNVAMEGFLAKMEKIEEVPKTIYLVLPTLSLPRIHIAGDDVEWWTDTRGNLISSVSTPWTEFVKNIHIYLHLPKAFGLLIVSIIGALFIGLIVSGIVSHPSIIKDAFKLRVGGNRRIELLDIHNRLSVWALPFHIMIGVTGAFFGLVGILVVLASSAFYNSDRQTLLDDVYGADPVVKDASRELQFDIAMKYLTKNYPESSPIYIAVQSYGTKQQFFEIAATFPKRLAYSEIFRFHSTGEFISRQNLIGGPVGRQALYSVYRLHFGHFNELGIRLLYIILGLSLTVISVTGINLWLQKKKESWFHQQWCALVWGFPLSLVVAAAGRFLEISVTYLFILTQIMCCVYCGLGTENTGIKKKILILILGVSLMLISLLHLAYFFNGGFLISVVFIDVSLLLIAITLIVPQLYMKFIVPNLVNSSV